MTNRNETKHHRKFGLRECLLLLLVVTVIVWLAGFIEDRRGQALAAQFQCIENLKRIDGAKENWAIEGRGPIERQRLISWSDLINNHYIKQIPKCPWGGTYTLGDMTQKPTCSVPGHSLF